MRFTLSIDLGNAAMQTSGDVADALMGVISKIMESEELEPGHATSIMDVNGNRVGQWKVRE
jgi:hypothetical protein